MVHILLSGVFFTGFFKDMLSLPRPLSPPLHRITMSGHVSLEYGFPSTHSTNAASVAVFALYNLRSPDCLLQDSTKLFLEFLSFAYVISIVLGRLYCGMHGFLDVIAGSLLGTVISVVECTYGDQFYEFLHNSSWKAAATIALVIVVLIRVHPEPADDCPCFDDSVASSGVMIGIEIGGWHYATGKWASNFPVPGTVPFSLEELGWVKTILRIVVGVLVIFAWREVMKPTLLKSLPHLFRVLEKYGFILPRKFFMPASEYKRIPARQRMDNVMPAVSDLPNLLNSIRHPGRGRSVSIGPQSAADAYETLAYREKRRRDSLRGTEDVAPYSSQNVLQEQSGNVSHADSTSSAFSSTLTPTISVNLPTPETSRVGSYEKLMGQGHVVFSPPTPPSDDPQNLSEEPDMSVGAENELGEKEIFSKLEKPRVRYDVEVVTKLVVYTGMFPTSISLLSTLSRSTSQGVIVSNSDFNPGIAMLAVEINPIIFEVIGLGLGGAVIQ